MRPTVFTLQHAYCNMATTPPWDVYNKLRQDGTPNVEDIATYLNRRLTVRRDTFNICAIFVAVKPQLIKKESCSLEMLNCGGPRPPNKMSGAW